MMARKHNGKGFDVHNSDAPDFQKKRCTDEELQDVASYLKQANSTYRFKEDARKELAQLIFNLKRGVPFQYAVGQSHTIRRTLRNKMVDAGLMEWDGGYHIPNTAAKMSLALPTDLFIAVINRYCQLKHGKGHIGYWEDPKTLNQLIVFRSFSEAYLFTTENGKLDPTQRFNYVRARGSDAVIRQRLIHAIHNKKKAVRPTVEIDGYPTARFDVKATHPQLLLHRYCKMPMDFDPYDIVPEHSQREELRGAAKLATMMMFNNSNRKSAGAAFRTELADPKHRNIRIAVSHLTGKQIEILDKVYARNPLLRPYFYKSLYLELMHWEANIAWNCMRRLAEQQIPSISVHDEIIVQHHHLKTALEVYKLCWIEETGIQGRGIVPVIDVKTSGDGESKEKK